MNGDLPLGELVSELYEGHRALLEDLVKIETSRREAFTEKEAIQKLTSTLDIDLLVVRLGEVLVPRFADWCIVDLVDPADPRRMRRRGVFHADTQFASAARTLQATDPATIPPNANFEIVDSMTELSPTIRILDELGLGPIARIPVRSRGSLAGVLHLASFRDQRVELAAVTDIFGQVLERAEAFRHNLDDIRKRDEAISIASHEFRSPLTALRLRMELILQEAMQLNTESPTLVKLIQACFKDIDFAVSLIIRLLEGGRDPGGRNLMETEALNLTELVREVVGRLADAEARTLFRFELDLDHPTIGSWDRLQIEQVILNLISNALKYGMGKPIEIRVQNDGRNAYLCVRDQGLGIPEDRKGRVFQRFERFHPEVGIPGFGLGLYIVQQNVKAHGGQVYLESQVGKGSTFTVEIPLRVVVRRPEISS